MAYRQLASQNLCHLCEILVVLYTSNEIPAKHLTITPRALVGYEMIANEARSAELAIIISYPTSASGIIVLLKMSPR